MSSHIPKSETTCLQSTTFKTSRRSTSRPILLYTLTLLFILATLFTLSTIRNNTSNYQLQKRDFEIFKKSSCRHIHNAKDQCSFYKSHCIPFDGDLVPYLKLYYCTLNTSTLQPFAILLILLFLTILFTALGTVAGDFFSVNLSSIARGLRMNDTLAGVTLLALGNGSPDIFSTFAAMKDDSSSMAIGELIGAASFITAVVAGSMALVKPFNVVKSSLIRDIAALMLTALFLTYIMTGHRLQLWHCICMLSFYVMYVVLIMAWHWWIWKHPTQHMIDDEDDERSEDIASPNQVLESTSLLNSARRQSVSYTALRRRSSVATYNPPPSFKGDDKPLSFSREIYAVLFPTLQNTQDMNFPSYVAAIFRAPIIFLIQITLPVVHEEVIAPSHPHGDYATHTITPSDDTENTTTSPLSPRWLLILQLYFAPQFLLLIAGINDLDPSPQAPLYLLLLSTFLALILILFTSRSTSSYYHIPPVILAPLAFLLSIAWISTIADEVVSLLQALGIIFSISEGILGITVFAIGNSIEDLVANISVARNGHPVMALSACFGGPLLNILLGIGGSGVVVILRRKGVAGNGSGRGERMRDAWANNGVHLHATRSLYITLAVLVATLVVFLLAMIFTRWRMTKGVGILLLGIWAAGTIVNVVVKVVG